MLMVYKYADSSEDDGGFSATVLANANRGGENVATGALIGALAGAGCGFSKLPAGLVQGLAQSQQQQLRAEIDQFVEVASKL